MTARDRVVRLAKKLRQDGSCFDLGPVDPLTARCYDACAEASVFSSDVRFRNSRRYTENVAATPGRLRFRPKVNLTFSKYRRAGIADPIAVGS
jgi:hypothetical protein